MQRKASLWALAALALSALVLLWSLAPQRLASGHTRTIVVATRDLPPSEPLARASLDFRELPESFVEDRHIGAEDVERLIGMHTNTAVAAGSSLLWTDLDATPPARTLAGLVQVGMRALTLPGRELGFDGLLRPGDRVDVLYTPRVPEDGALDDGETIALLENALVLTVGRDLGMGVERGEDARAGQEVSRGDVTLSVSPHVALRLAHAEGRGTLRLALRNPQDVALAEVLAGGAGGRP
jgi:pilus assembly protein CpaB